MGFNLKKWLKEDQTDNFATEGTDVSDSYYTLKPEEALLENDGNSKMVLLEPRAYSESQQIVDFLKSRNAVTKIFPAITFFVMDIISSMRFGSIGPTDVTDSIK